MLVEDNNPGKNLEISSNYSVLRAKVKIKEKITASVKENNS